jgi:hypothetical protein
MTALDNGSWFMGENGVRLLFREFELYTQVRLHRATGRGFSDCQGGDWVLVDCSTTLRRCSRLHSHASTTYC